MPDISNKGNLIQETGPHRCLKGEGVKRVSQWQLGMNDTREQLWPSKSGSKKEDATRKNLGIGRCVLREYNPNQKGDSMTSCCSHFKKTLPQAWYLDGQVGHSLLGSWTNTRLWLCECLECQRNCGPGGTRKPQGMQSYS